MNETLQDILEKYRSMKLGYRLLLVVIVALLWPALKFSEESTAKQDGLELAQSAADAVSVEYKATIKKTEELPALERDIKFIENELNEAFKKLPNDVNIAEVLSNITVAARRSGVKLMNFVPQEEKKPSAKLKYAEKGIQLELSGTYRDLGAFLDEIIHFERLMFVEKASFNLPRKRGRKNVKRASRKAFDAAKISDFEQAKLNRRNIVLNSKVDIIIYKSVE